MMVLEMLFCVLKGGLEAEIVHAFLPADLQTDSTTALSVLRPSVPPRQQNPPIKPSAPRSLSILHPIFAFPNHRPAAFCFRAPLTHPSPVAPDIRILISLPLDDTALTSRRIDRQIAGTVQQSARPRAHPRPTARGGRCAEPTGSRDATYDSGAARVARSS